MGKFHLVELCCGSAALTMHLLFARRQVVPYQGSKWRLRRELAAVLVERGFTELGASTLNDIGPWGGAWWALRNHPGGVARELRKLNNEDPRDVFDLLHGGLVPVMSVDLCFAAEFLFLQRLSHSGKAVGTKGGCWCSPGFNETSAYGVAASERFGEIKPMIPSLISVVESMQELTWPQSVNYQMHVEDVPIFPFGLPLVIYIDPNYVNSTGYPNGSMSRKQVVSVSRRLAARCDTTVMVSEAEPIPELVEAGWEARCLRQPPKDNKPFQTKSAEWVTLWPPSTLSLSTS